MKRIILAMAVLTNCTFMMAQTEFDALKLVQTDINGTARYMGMAGAFGALGGDPSAIKDNPAGLGIYRKSEFTGTYNFMMQKSSSTWNETKGMDDLYKNGFNNISYIIASPTWNSKNGSMSGLLNSNWSFAYNRLKSFNRRSTVKSDPTTSSISQFMGYFTEGISVDNLKNDPYNNMDIPWLSILAYQGFLIDPIAGTNNWMPLIGDNENVTPSYSLQESGYVDEYSLGWSGNFSNMFYLGAALNFQSINYKAVSQYGEAYSNNRGMSLENTTYTSGNGFNLNVGTIIRPVDFLRFGLSLHTPTIYNLTDNNYSKLDYYVSSADNGYSDSPTGYTNSYKLQNPLQINASAALIVGKKGLISAEYVYSDYTTSKFMDENNDASDFSEENAGMKDMLKAVQTIKVGGEFRLTNNFSLRAGYANMSAATQPEADKLMRFNTTRSDTEYFQHNSTNYLTGGFGYHEASWYIDFAYMNKIADETFFPYNSNDLSAKANSAAVLTTSNNAVVTLGFKF